MNVHDLIAMLDQVRQHGDSWVASCPAHEDKSPSLTIREVDDGKILMHCFAGCGVDQIASALGITLSDLFPPKPEEHSVAGLRKPFPASAVLSAIGREAFIVRLAAIAMRNGHLSDYDEARLIVATERITDALRYV